MNKVSKYAKYKDLARQKAIDWQLDFNNHNYSYLELAMFQEKFERLAKRYGFVKEFKENCII